MENGYYGTLFAEYGGAPIWWATIWETRNITMSKESDGVKIGEITSYNKDAYADGYNEELKAYLKLV